MAVIPVKPLRYFKGDTRKQLLELLEEAFREAGLLRSCVTCEHFEDTTEICQRWNARPPANTIAFGCDDFIDSDGNVK